MTRYLWVAAREAEGFPTVRACEAAGVSRQSFYDWKQRVDAGPTPVEVAEARLVEKMREIHRGDDTVGSPRMTMELNNLGWEVNHKRVERLMRVHGIVGIPKRRTVRTTIRAEAVRRSPIWWVAASFPGRRTGGGVQTSPTSPPGRAGYIWPPSSISARDVCSATRWPTTCEPAWSPLRWKWPSGSGAAAVTG